MVPSLTARLGRSAVRTAGVLVVLATAGTAQAQTDLVGSTTGCFTATSCTPAPAASPAATVSWEAGALTYTGRTNVVFGQFIGNAFAGNPISLGTLTLTRTPNRDFNGDSFSLLVSFTSPTPGDDNIYTAALSGSLNGGGNGSVVFDFGPAQQFSVGSYLFELTVDDRTLTVSGSNSPDTQALTGTIRMVTATPEPTTVALLGTGLLGLVGVGARRRRAIA